ncbi:MAG: DUF3145 family protein [Actinobacteria bacterium]|nr:DUF3145 family protein [Actinomycetota bacterium]
MELISPPQRGFPLSRGYLAIHSAPSALCRHLDWALVNLLGPSATLSWRPQPLLPGSHRAICEWRDREGAGADLASTLRGWHYVRFEIREESDREKVLYRYTPNLGIHRAVIDELGSVLISENQIMHALAQHDDDMRETMDKALGTSWERELDQFRRVDLEAISQSQAI